MVYRADITLENTELLQEITLRWNTYSKTIPINYPYDNLDSQLIPSNATGLPSDLLYSFTHIENNPYNNLLAESWQRYEFQFRQTNTGEQESEKEWGLEGLIIESPRYKPLIIDNEMETFELKHENKLLYAWNTQNYCYEDSGQIEDLIVYTHSPTPSIGDEVFTKRGEAFASGMYVSGKTGGDYSMEKRKVITGINGNILTIGNKT